MQLPQSDYTYITVDRRVSSTIIRRWGKCSFSAWGMAGIDKRGFLEALVWKLACIFMDAAGSKSR